MDVREKLVELLDRFVYDDLYSNNEIAEKLMANGVTVQEGIPVEDRLPENDGQYLIFTTQYMYLVFVRHTGANWQPPKGE